MSGTGIHRADARAAEKWAPAFAGTSEGCYKNVSDPSTKPDKMPLELWILLAVIGVGAIGAVVVRRKRRRMRQTAAGAGTESNVYPLW